MGWLAEWLHAGISAALDWQGAGSGWIVQTAERCPTGLLCQISSYPTFSSNQQTSRSGDRSQKQGIGVRPESADALSMSRIFSLDTKDVALVCLCYVANPTSAQIRYAIRRLRRKAAEAFILVSMIGGADNVSGSEEVRACQADDVRQSLTETIDQIKDLARGVQGANDASSDTLVSKAG